MFQLNNDLQRMIYQFDSTFKEKFDLVLEKAMSVFRKRLAIRNDIVDILPYPLEVEEDQIVLHLEDEDDSLWIIKFRELEYQTRIFGRQELVEEYEKFINNKYLKMSLERLSRTTRLSQKAIQCLRDNLSGNEFCEEMRRLDTHRDYEEDEDELLETLEDDQDFLMEMGISDCLPTIVVNWLPDGVEREYKMFWV